MKPKVVYHFTSVTWLRFIEREGIYRGKCPITSSTVLDHPNFTTDPDPESQKWACGSAINKRAVRITVKVRHHDNNWHRWIDMARSGGASAAFIRSLNENGGGGMKNWWIHKGTVFPSDFVAVERIGDPTAFDLHAARHAEEWGSKTYEEYLRREIAEGYTEMVLDKRVRNSKRYIAVPTTKANEEVAIAMGTTVQRLLEMYGRRL